MCETITWDPTRPDKIHYLKNELTNELNSLRVYDDGYQGYDKHMGYVELMGKRVMLVKMINQLFQKCVMPIALTGMMILIWCIHRQITYILSRF